MVPRIERLEQRLMFSARATAAPLPLPVGEWLFNTFLGDTVPDNTGRGHDGSLVNDPSYGGAPDGSLGYYFDGSGQSVSVPDAKVLDPARAITIGVYVKPSQWDDGRRLLDKGTASQTQYALYDDAGALRFILGGVGSATAPLPAVGAWHAVVATYDGTALSIYVDGNLAGSVAAAGPIKRARAPLVIGDAPGSADASEAFEGTLGDVKVYAAAVPAAAIGLIFAAPSLVTPATASEDLITGTSVRLSALGASLFGGSNLSYLWDVPLEPANAADPDFSDNDANSPNSLVATFHQAGDYTFAVQINDDVLSISSAVDVTVHQTLSSIVVLPAAARVAPGGAYQFTAVALDQFGHAMDHQPQFTWSTSGGGSITAGGLYVAPAAVAAGPLIITASAGGVGGSAMATVGGSPAAPGTPDAVTQVEALAPDGTTVQVIWKPAVGGPAADGFVVSASSDGGATFTPVVVAPAGAGSCLATGLTGQDDYLFRVTPFNAAGLGPAARSAASVTTGFGPGPGPARQWYRVTFDGNASDATAAVLGSGTGSFVLAPAVAANDGWVKAASASDAVRKSLSGSFLIGGNSFSFPGSGASYFVRPYFSADGNYSGPAVIFDSGYAAGGPSDLGQGVEGIVDGNTGDAYVPVTVTQESMYLQATTVTRDLPSPADLSLTRGAVVIGRASIGDPYATASDFNAIVTWHDGRTSRLTATTTQYQEPYFALSVVPPRGERLGASYRIDLAQAHTPTTATDNTRPNVYGRLAGRAGGTVVLSLKNTGDAALPAGTTVSIYASASAAELDRPVLVGQTRTKQAIGPRSSGQVSVPISLKPLAPGMYHLVATTQAEGLFPVAAQQSTFVIHR
jgi:hypothetical protein